MPGKKFPIKPPVFGAIYLLIAFLVNHYFRYTIIQKPYTYFGIIIIFAGFFLLFRGAYLFRTSKTPIVPGEKPKFMIQKWPYTFSRNPIYLGMGFILSGIFVCFGKAALIIAPILFFITIRMIFIPFEEKLMAKTFGKKYLDYRKRVRRWI